METVKIQFFQDHHILQIWKLLKISFFKTSTTTQGKSYSFMVLYQNF